ncbi:MAG: T9SS type A sorting domain-containing protein [Minisyncoccia bacterium]
MTKAGFSQSVQYKYDALNRLTQLSSGCSGIKYEYDKNGNRTTSTKVSIETTNTITNERCGNDGQITLKPKDSTARYEYQWSNGKTTASIDRLKGGSYSVVITDKPTGFTCARSFIITSTFKDSVSVEQQNIVCNGANNGKAKVKIITPHPQGSYRYKWSTATDTAHTTLDSLNNLKPGSYSVSIRNTATGCVKTVSFSITEPPLFVTGTSKTNASCPTGMDGTAKVDVLGDPAGYTYSWTGPSITKTTQAVSGLGVGTYTVTVVQNATKCSVTRTVTIEPTLAIATITAGGSTTFFTGKNVVLSANTGSGYSYKWMRNGTDLPGAISSSYTAIESGSYAVSITFNGCTVTSASITVTATFTLPVTNFKVAATAKSCRTNDNGAIAITATEQLNYSVTLNPEKGPPKQFTFSKSLEIKDLSAGKYSVCITVAGKSDYKQCFDVEITEPKDLSVYSFVDNSKKILDLVLDGGKSYQITLNGVVYTTSQNKISLNLLEGQNQLRVVADNLCQGVYERILTLSNDIVTYPNPFEQQLTVNLGNNTSKTVALEIRNVIGILIYSGEFKNTQGTISVELPEMVTGVYTLSLALDTSEIIYRKIIRK